MYGGGPPIPVFRCGNNSFEFGEIVMQNKDKDEEEYVEIDLLHLLKVLWERVWLMILAAVIAGGAAFGYAYLFVEPMYRSTARFYVNNSSFSVGSAEFSISSSQISAAQSLVDTYIVILESRTNLEQVIEKAGLDYDYEELDKMVSAAPVNNTEIFKVDVESTDPSEAANIANTICTVLPRSISNVVDGSDVRIVDYAVVPIKRVSPSYTKYSLIGAVIGIVISAAAIILSDLLDDMIHDTSYLTQNYDIPVLSVIPSLIDDERSSRRDKGKQYGEYGYKGRSGKKEM